MHFYYGVNPVSVIPISPAPGYGVWPDVQEADDDDDRDAASMMIAIEALTDKINFVGWRMINIVDGGVYAFATAITIANPWTTHARTVPLGVGAWRAHRAPIHINGADKTYAFTDGDTFIIDAFSDGLTHTHTFVAPVSNVPALYRFRVREQPGFTAAVGNTGVMRFNLVNSTHYVATFTWSGGGLGQYFAAGIELEFDSSTGFLVVCNRLDPSGVISLF